MYRTNYTAAVVNMKSGEAHMQIIRSARGQVPSLLHTSMQRRNFVGRCRSCHNSFDPFKLSQRTYHLDKIQNLLH
jgi:hypothetical protein